MVVRVQAIAWLRQPVSQLGANFVVDVLKLLAISGDTFDLEEKILKGLGWSLGFAGA